MNCDDVSCGSDTGKVWVGVKDLVLIPQSDLYEFVGQIANAHISTHYMRYEPMLQVVVLSALYHQRFSGDPILRLNDASLERGGYFDIELLWDRGEHSTHRLGTDIDIRANPRENPSTAIPEKNFREFELLAQRIGGCAERHKWSTLKQHYHVKFSGC